MRAVRTFAILLLVSLLVVPAIAQQQKVSGSTSLTIYSQNLALVRTSLDRILDLALHGHRVPLEEHLAFIGEQHEVRQPPRARVEGALRRPHGGTGEPIALEGKLLSRVSCGTLRLDEDDLDLVSVLFLKLERGRHGPRNAARSPGSPEVHQDRLTAQSVEALEAHAVDE